MVSQLGDSLIQSLGTLLSSPHWSPGHQLPWGTLWAPHTQQSLLLRPARCLLRALGVSGALAYRQPLSSVGIEHPPLSV